MSARLPGAISCDSKRTEGGGVRARDSVGESVPPSALPLPEKARGSGAVKGWRSAGAPVVGSRCLS